MTRRFSSNPCANEYRYSIGHTFPSPIVIIVTDEARREGTRESAGDNDQFLMIDLEDPAATAFGTDGWNGNTLILSSITHALRSFSPYRIRYEVNDAQRFTVTWEIRDGPDWVKQPSVACVRVGPQDQSDHASEK